MYKINKLEKYIYKFLKYLNKNDFNYANSKLTKKYKIDNIYFRYIVSECINSKYIDGIIYNTNLNNEKSLVISNHIYITRNGYIFINNYRRQMLNLFLIPLKNLLIIILTAFITSFITYNIEHIVNFFKNFLS